MAVDAPSQSRPKLARNGYFREEPPPPDDQLAEIEARHVACTPGPYRWRGNAENYDLHLRTTWGGGYYVLGFRRWGWSHAEPVFLGTRVSRVRFEDGQRIETPYAWEPDAVDQEYDRRVRQSGARTGHPSIKARPLNEKRSVEVGRPIITPAHHYLKYEVAYRHDIVGIAHPDATALERSWEDREWLIAEVKRLRAALAEKE